MQHSVCARSFHFFLSRIIHSQFSTSCTYISITKSLFVSAMPEFFGLFSIIFVLCKCAVPTFSRKLNQISVPKWSLNVEMVEAPLKIIINFNLIIIIMNCINLNRSERVKWAQQPLILTKFNGNNEFLGRATVYLEINIVAIQFMGGKRAMKKICLP